MPAIHNLRRQRPRVPVLGLALLIATLALPASAQDFVSSNRTVVGGNPLGGGFTLNPSQLPEPATASLLLLALPAMGVAVRRRCRIA